MSSLRKTDTIQRPRFLAQLLGVFAALALLLAAVGTHGMFSYIVAERRGEIGIRMALGAQRLGVLAHIMKEGLVLAGIAVAVGLAAASPQRAHCVAAVRCSPFRCSHCRWCGWNIDHRRSSCMSAAGMAGVTTGPHCGAKSRLEVTS
jgi:hypothetical protein